jgi:hypothetical protein
LTYLNGLPVKSVHQDGQTKLAAAQPDKTSQAANGNAPSKRLLKIGTADSGRHALFVTALGFGGDYLRDHFGLRASRTLGTGARYLPQK